MADPQIKNTHIIGYQCGTHAPESIKESMIDFANQNQLDLHFYVSAVRNIKNVYTEKGFIYTTTKNFFFLKDIIEGVSRDFDADDVFSFEDETGFPLSYTAYVANVYEFGETMCRNKLFCRDIPKEIGEKELKEIFNNFTTKKKKSIRNLTEVMNFPIIHIKETPNSRSAVVIFEDSTKDAYYAYIMVRRIDFKNNSLIFSPYIHRKENNGRKRGGRGRR